MNLRDRINKLNEFHTEQLDVLNGKKMTLQSHQIAIERFNESIEETRFKIELNDKSIIVLSNLVDTKTADVLDKLKKTIDNALSVVPLTNEYTIHITENETKRSGKELHIKLFDREANKPRGLRTASGTAVAQLVSFIIRIVLIGFSDKRKILIVDENFSGFQDKETINMFGSVLTSLAEQEGFQIIMVEHKSEFLNVPKIKNIILEKENYLEGVVVKDIIDASSFEED